MESDLKSHVFLPSAYCSGIEIDQFTWDHAVYWIYLLLLLGN